MSAEADLCLLNSKNCDWSVAVQVTFSFRLHHRRSHKRSSACCWRCARVWRWLRWAGRWRRMLLVGGVGWTRFSQITHRISGNCGFMETCRPRGISCLWPSTVLICKFWIWGSQMGATLRKSRLWMSVPRDMSAWRGLSLFFKARSRNSLFCSMTKWKVATTGIRTWTPKVKPLFWKLVPYFYLRL